MSYNLFLDDIRQPYSVGDYFSPADKRVLFRTLEWVIVKNYDEFINTISTMGIPKLIAFDHDLADEHYTPEEHWTTFETSAAWQDAQKYKEKTGYDCALWLIDYLMKGSDPIPEFLCHSQNPVGKERILGVLNRFKRFQNE